MRRDFQEFARLAEAPYRAAVVDPVLETLEDLWTTSVVGVRTTTHPVPRRRLNVRLVNAGVEADPVSRLRAAGLLEFVGHPMERLLTEIPAAVPVFFGVDVDVAHGVEKIWMMFPELIAVDRVLAFPGMPEAARAHAAHLHRYGGEIAIMALDFGNRTLNLYSQVLAPGVVTPADITTILSDLAFVAATPEELALLDRTFNLYRTFSWNSPRMQRICFPVRYEAARFPTHLDPVLARFVAAAPHATTGPRNFTFYTAYGPTDRYYKIQAEYTAAQPATFPAGAIPQIN
ncbi:aromatic prenyltransferase [Nocardia yunnanensis]|nr:aromatic prenyltransferase [Nocardia yunnanensis]